MRHWGTPIPILILNYKTMRHQTLTAFSKDNPNPQGFWFRISLTMKCQRYTLLHLIAVTTTTKQKNSITVTVAPISSKTIHCKKSLELVYWHHAFASPFIFSAWVCVVSLPSRLDLWVKGQCRSANWVNRDTGSQHQLCCDWAHHCHEDIGGVFFSCEDACTWVLDEFGKGGHDFGVARSSRSASSQCLSCSSAHCSQVLKMCSCFPAFTNSNTLPKWGIEQSLNPLTTNLTFYSNQEHTPTYGE